MLIDCCDAQTFLAGVDKLAVITYSPTDEQGRLGGAGKCSCAYATGAHKHQATSLQVATHSPPLSQSSSFPKELPDGRPEQGSDSSHFTRRLLCVINAPYLIEQGPVLVQESALPRTLAHVLFERPCLFAVHILGCYDFRFRCAIDSASSPPLYSELIIYTSDKF